MARRMPFKTEELEKLTEYVVQNQNTTEIGGNAEIDGNIQVNGNIINNNNNIIVFDSFQYTGGDYRDTLQLANPFNAGVYLLVLTNTTFSFMLSNVIKLNNVDGYSSTSNIGAISYIGDSEITASINLSINDFGYYYRASLIGLSYLPSGLQVILYPLIITN